MGIEICLALFLSIDAHVTHSLHAQFWTNFGPFVPAPVLPHSLNSFSDYMTLVNRGICRLKHNTQRCGSSGCYDTSEKVGIEVQRRRNRSCGELSAVNCHDSYTEIKFKCNTGGQPGIADVPHFLRYTPNPVCVYHNIIRLTSGTNFHRQPNFLD